MAFQIRILKGKATIDRIDDSKNVITRDNSQAITVNTNNEFTLEIGSILNGNTKPKSDIADAKIYIDGPSLGDYLQGKYCAVGDIATADTVSRSHCCITLSDTGIIVADLNSTNGTKILTSSSTIQIPHGESKEANWSSSDSLIVQCSQIQFKIEKCISKDLIDEEEENIEEEVPKIDTKRCRRKVPDKYKHLWFYDRDAGF